jgi:hypothetical protein
LQARDLNLQATISCRHSCQWEGDLRQLPRDRHGSTRFGNEEPSGPETELVEAQYVGAWLSLVERPVRSRHEARQGRNAHEHVKPLNGIQLAKIQLGQRRSGQAGSESCTLRRATGEDEA